MIFWQHDGDLSKPPELSDLQYRRPTSKHYWESKASDKKTARETFWVRWRRETGKDYPRTLPLAPSCDKPQHAFVRQPKAHRPKHQHEKEAQDRKNG